ncbi:molybdopterin molybdenumtransferase MoeA [Loktanella sp. D2R18]|uniref:molybdopterin molybdotransferase MoeA n=1 Tax=Rhodobacterales TaxID=204455 RepID=UPI000DEB8682|nr:MULTISPECIES: gephyrin-like molybdotransferase Glp [Rhodobacterales]MDO6590641.1 molybdopterin molybdotransferase MoeA [Yoonia sp. 1_MG-2023]RBW44733.1 molybdopterin molybdenumtransferase MoeA [Loktanella sp. D2R18]
MITVDAALDHLFALSAPLAVETVPLTRAFGRNLARDVTATRDQPPFAASAMDGYAVCRADVRPGIVLQVIGEAAAGHALATAVKPGEAARIFTGAPLPAGADHVVIQEDVTRAGDMITLGSDLETKPYVRPAGADFRIGDQIKAPRVLSAADIALLASMNIAQVPVSRRPVVAIIATGDELVQPGETPDPDQIIASNSFGLAALVQSLGAHPRLLPIARDNIPALELAFDLAGDADLIVTIGGASVGDHDLVGQVAQSKGMQQAFYKIAMRPGKPLMAGRMGTAVMIGLPGNPVSAMVCGHVFLAPVIRHMLGQDPTPAPRQSAVLAAQVGPNGSREHYTRARLGPDGVTVFERQDSALLTVLADANCLAIRPINDPARAAGDKIQIIPL